MAHIFFIDPIEKLNIKKDSTLMMALTFQKQGHDCYLLFEKDFYVTNDQESELIVYRFNGRFKDDGYYLDQFNIEKECNLKLSSKDYLHMRIDPPYDSRYQRYLWMLNFLVETVGLEVVNNPLKIMKHNEKLVAYKDKERSHSSYIGSSIDGFNKFIDKLKKSGETDIILKPLDLYSGIGVEKVSLIDKNIENKFKNKVAEFQGAIIAQPFIKDVYNGEYRSIYFDGKELGTIIKRPNKGEFLANIAQGAAFEAVDLPLNLKKVCDEMSKELFEDGVRFLAFDLLGSSVNEVNVTCPGLLVEVSYACQKNLGELISKELNI